MKISIKFKKNKEINIKLPLFLSGFTLIYCNKEFKEYRLYFRSIYRTLKHYIKENGHFQILNIERNDLVVKIIV